MKYAMNYFLTRFFGLCLLSFCICLCSTKNEYFDILISEQLTEQENDLFTNYVWSKLGKDVTILTALTDEESVYSIKTQLNADQIVEKLELLKLVKFEDYWKCETSAIRSLKPNS